MQCLPNIENGKPMKKDLKKQDKTPEFLIYTANDGETKISVRLISENIWLTQKQISQLFNVDRSVVSKHLANIFEEGELEENSVCAKFAHTAADNKEYLTSFYSLDAIISVGYRVNSQTATKFRIWATKTLKNYIVKGFAIDKERLKDPEGKDYFEQLLADIREIRASEKRFYHKVRDIYATSIDYDKTADMTKEFFSIVQNKMLWAVCGKTSAEIIKDRVNSKKPNMGLTSWKGKRIHRADVIIAKNYLDKREIDQLERIVSMFLDFAELQAMNKKAMKMADWIKKLDGFLSLNEREILNHAGKVSKKLADKKASEEFDKFEIDYKKDELKKADEQFDRELKTLEKLNKQKKATKNKKPKR
jgi:hypothetical protein